MTLLRGPVAAPHADRRRSVADRDAGRRSPVAAPDGDRLQTPLQRVGALLWWRFLDAATALPTLAGSARGAGFPAIFLPVPFPVSRSVAFQRALRRATAKVPGTIGGQWTAEATLVRGREAEKALTELGLGAERLGIRSLKGATDDRLLLAQVMELDRANLKRPWATRIVCLLFLETGELSLEVIPFIATPATAAEVRRAAADARRMARLTKAIRAKYDEERTLATYPEIGDGVMDALEDVGGVKLRPGLFSVPGQAGIERADAAVQYLRTIGGTRAGIMDLYDERKPSGAPEGLVQLALLEAVDALADEIERADLAAKQTGAIRTQWDRIGALEERIRANRQILGPAAGELIRRLERPRKRLRQAASERGIELTRRGRPSDVKHLEQALATLRRVAKTGDVTGLEEARPLLVRAQAAALAGGFAPLLRRLRKLADAAEHVHEGPLYRALGEAVGFVEERARAAYPEDFAEAAPGGGEPGG